MFTSNSCISKRIVIIHLKKNIFKVLNIFGFISYMISILLKKKSEKNDSVSKGLLIKFCLSALTYGSKNYRKIH